MRVVRRALCARLYPLPDGLHFTPIMSLRAIHEGLRLVEVPIPYEERVGRSKLNVVRDGLRYAQSIVWTALGYNPVRVLGTLGVAGVGLAGLVGVGLVIMRLRGVTVLGPWGVAAIFGALVAGVAASACSTWAPPSTIWWRSFGVSRCARGCSASPSSTRRSTATSAGLGWRRGRRRGARRRFDRAGPTGWPIDQLWLYLVGSALLMLVGCSWSFRGCSCASSKKSPSGRCTRKWTCKGALTGRE